MSKKGGYQGELCGPTLRVKLFDAGDFYHGTIIFCFSFESNGE